MFKKVSNIVLFSSLLVLISLNGCSDNVRVKKYGGEAILEIPSNRKFVNVTWKNDNLWVLTKDRGSDTTYEKFFFHEESAFGIIEGTYIINESK